LLSTSIKTLWQARMATSSKDSLIGSQSSGLTFSLETQLTKTRRREEEKIEIKNEFIN